MKIVIHYTKKGAIICAMILLAIGTAIISVMRNGGDTTPQRIVASPASAPVQQTNEGPVDVKVTHETKQSIDKTHVFSVVLDTHSGDLSTFDAATNILYRPTKGNETLPVVIGGDRESHHRTIIATFNDTTIPGTLAVKNLRGVPEQTFPITL